MRSRRSREIKRTIKNHKFSPQTNDNERYFAIKNVCWCQESLRYHTTVSFTALRARPNYQTQSATQMMRDNPGNMVCLVIVYRPCYFELGNVNTQRERDRTGMSEREIYAQVDTTKLFGFFLLLLA